MKPFYCLISIIFVSSLVCTTAAAQSVKSGKKASSSSKTKKASSEDPNLKKNSDKSKTEADFCVQCSDRSATKNQKDIKAVSDKISDKSGDNVEFIKEAGKWNDHPEVVEYSESPKVEKSIFSALKNRASKSTAMCYKFVKDALVSAKMVKSRPPGGHARDAVGDLKEQGYINMLEKPEYKSLIKSPDDAPKGAVLVYHNGTSESGDTQIKTDWGSEGGYVNDFLSQNSYLESPKARRLAREGQPMKLIGVMIKPQAESQK